MCSQALYLMTVTGYSQDKVDVATLFGFMAYAVHAYDNTITPDEVQPWA